MLRGEDHICRTEEGVRAGCKYFDLETLVEVNTKCDLGADALTDPVALHQLDGVGPVEEIKVVD
ncbi:unannotated protein [freshwater metagenome]|uniref:Unannotated protein n=1 Tax=freshwater metagenome TaxID=449393 RepID=A0A6J7PUA5_9ZZZZ